MSVGPARRAVVLGAGVAGLCAARVLIEHAGEVVIVERDALPTDAQDRPGVPQGRHLHSLLLRGQRELETLFPGFGADLDSGGAARADLAQDVPFLSIWGWAPRYRSDLVARLATRALIEAVLRERVRRLPGVRLLERHDAAGLVMRDGSVAGVCAQPRDGGVATEIEAVLVLDARGRRSRTHDVLAGIGLPSPPETVVDARLGYATRLYARPARRFDWQALLVRDPMPSARLAGLFPAGDGRWTVTLAGFGPHRPPTDESGFDAFVAGLADPTLADALRDARPLGGVMGYRETANRWRHFERLPRWPSGLAMLGDSVCTFNPLYGQGMTVAVLGALALRGLLDRRGLTPAVGDPLRRAVARVLAVPWSLATSEDCRYGDASATARGPLLRARHWLGDQVARAGMRDPDVHYRWMRVAQLLDPPRVLLRPNLLLRVLAARAR